MLLLCLMLFVVVAFDINVDAAAAVARENFVLHKLLSAGAVVGCVGVVVDDVVGRVVKICWLLLCCCQYVKVVVDDCLSDVAEFASFVFSFLSVVGVVVAVVAAVGWIVTIN